MQTYYLNNTGSRWIRRPNTEKYLLYVPQDKYYAWRKVKYYEALGNFALCAFDYVTPDGKRMVVKGFAHEDSDGRVRVTIHYGEEVK